MPTWFHIKFDSNITSGAKHFFGMIERTKMLGDEVKNIAYARIAGNGYFAHHENVLLAMVCDDQPHVRQLAWRRILKARAEFSGHNNIRAFILPKINMEAEIYFDMVDWKSGFTEPPLTCIHERRN